MTIKAANGYNGVIKGDELHVIMGKVFCANGGFICRTDSLLYKILSGKLFNQY